MFAATAGAGPSSAPPPPTTSEIAAAEAEQDAGGGDEEGNEWRAYRGARKEHCTQNLCRSLFFKVLKQNKK